MKRSDAQYPIRELVPSEHAPFAPENVKVLGPCRTSGHAIGTPCSIKYQFITLLIIYLHLIINESSVLCVCLCMSMVDVYQIH